MRHRSSQRVRVRLGLILTAVCLLLGACGNSSSSSTASDTVADSSSADGSPTPVDPFTSDDSDAESTPADADKTIVVGYVDDAGWTYSFSVDYPNVSYEFGKEISSSPPGEAQLRATLTGEFAGFGTHGPTNVGRPNGPTLTPEYHLAYDTSWSSDDFLTVGDGCTFSGNDGLPGREPEPFAKTLDCIPGVPGTSAALARSESSVNRAVSRLNRQTPVLVLTLVDNDTYGDCSIFIDKGGVRGHAKTYSESGCGKASIKVVNA